MRKSVMRKDIVTEYTIENTAGDITLWLLFLEGISEAEFEEMYALCSRERQEKADGIKPDMKRKQSIGAGYLLSMLKKRFSIGEEPVILTGGKPVFGKRPLGADIEYVKEANIKIAKRFFTDEEYIRISEQEEKAQGDMFCRIWTGKEAVVKAAGGGLILPLNGFSVLEKNVDLLGKRYELYRRKFEIKGRSLWVSAAQSVTDTAEDQPM